MALRWRHLGVGSQYEILALVVILCSPKFICALSNLDVTEPIVRMSPSSLLNADNFGFSVLLHQVEIPVAGDFDSFINNTRILVGAPKGTYPGGVDGLPTLDPVELTGLVYQCPVAAPGDCKGLSSTLSSNPENYDRRLFDGDPNSDIPHPENKSEQLMGSSLASNGHYFMACAPRWVIDPDITTNIDGRRPIGRCYVSPRNLQGFQLIMPCTGERSSSPLPGANADNQCLAGFSGAFFTALSSEGSGRVALGVVGDQLFNGNIFYYDVNSTDSVTFGRTTTLSSSRITSLYDGYSTTVGFITNTVTEDLISGVPRFDGTVLVGGVRVRSSADYTVNSVINVTGTQTGEYFGFSVAVSDLNNDGYDELLVGAPIYSTPNLQEMGRVYIYENTGGDLSSDPIILNGTARNGARFGTSVINLEDVNGDGYEDIAVGSPYEVNGDTDNTGAVYVYYGSSSENGLVSRTPNQVILASDIVSNVPVVSSIRSFGYSLFSGIDVDGNTVNDLLIGAYESKMAVLIRSLSVAYVNVTTLTTNTQVVVIDTTGTAGSNFSLTVCATYSGRGLDGRSLDTSLSISEVTRNDVPRLYFQNTPSINGVTIDFVFPSTDVQQCVDVLVFVKSVSQLSGGQVDLLSPLQVRVAFPPLSRRTPSFVGGDPVDLIDYRTVPLLIVEGTRVASVSPSVNCPLDMNLREVCSPDLIVTLVNITYLDDQNVTRPERGAIADVTQTINVNLEYVNIGADPAFGSVFKFTLPQRLSHLRVDVPPNTPQINCLRVGDTSLYTCGLPTYIPQNVSMTLKLVWRVVSGRIVGNEPDDISNANISLVSTRDTESNITNNELINGPITIEYSAISDLDVPRVEFLSGPPTYSGVGPTQMNPTVDEIGMRVQLTVNAVNRGPSTTSGATLDIFIPTNDVENSYYLYLYDVTVTGAPATCDRSALNPEGLPLPGNRNRRRRRQASSDTAPATLIPAEIRNCSDPTRMASCTRIRCTTSSLAIQTSATINVFASLDERFFQSQQDPFEFVAYANFSNDDKFLEDPNPENNQLASDPYRVTLVVADAGSFPIWIPIVCGIVAVIIIIVLFVILYFVGFFRRKKLEHDKAEGDFTPPPEELAVPQSEKPVVAETAFVPVDGDIGGTEDLEDGSMEKPNLDPDETSI